MGTLTNGTSEIALARTAIGPAISAAARIRAANPIALNRGIAIPRAVSKVHSGTSEEDEGSVAALIGQYANSTSQAASSACQACNAGFSSIRNPANFTLPVFEAVRAISSAASVGSTAGVSSAR